MSYRILEGDVIDRLRDLPDESVQCVVTSPPYFGLRDYGVAGQIGLEKTPGEYLARMCSVFCEVRRVLRKDGTCWVNMGDSYAGSWGAQSRGNTTGEEKSKLEGSSPLYARSIKAHPLGLTGVGSLKRTPGLKPKDLMGIPWRLAFALQEDGWWLRQDIIWAKPNPMPESVIDRCTKAHEYIFMLTKSARYLYDAAAIRTELSAETKALSFETMDYKRRGQYKKPTGWASEGNHAAAEWATQQRQGRGDKQRGHSRRHDGFNDRWDAMPKEEQQASGANKRSVWTIATQGYPEAHFATFPEALVEPCILAGSKPGDVVLDPFSGSGTTGVVALRYHRKYIGIELNAEYAAMSRRRIESDQPLFNAEVSA